MPKILYIVNICAPYRVDFFNELGKNNDLVVIFESEKVNNRSDTWYKKNFENFKGIILKDESIIFKLKDVIKTINGGNFDHIVLGGYSTKIGVLLSIYFKINKTKYVLNTDGAILKKETWIKYNLKKMLISSANKWLSSGDVTSDYLKNYGAKEKEIFKYPFTSIYNRDILTENEISISKKEFFKRKLNINEEVCIVCVSRFIKSKGIEDLLNSLNDYENVGLYIIGGRPTNEYTEIIEKKRLKNVHFIDFLKKNEVDEYYMAGDLFVLPTKSDVWGLVINEAMAKGLPILTTDMCNAGVELIENEVNGYIVKSGNLVELRDKLHFLIVNEKIRLQIANNNIKKIKKYTIENMAKVTEEILEKKN